MSARNGPVGASARLDLFTPRNQLPSMASQPSRLSTSLTSSDIAEKEVDSGNPLRLKWMVGHNAIAQGLLAHPADPNLFIRSLGAVIALESAEKPNFQHLLRAHDMPITSLDVSQSGALIASGQLGSRSGKGYAAPIFVWHIASGKRIAVLKGLSVRVNIVRISPDERFVFGAGEDCCYCVWELATGETICGNRTSAPLSVMTWMDSFYESRDLVHRLCVGSGGQLLQGRLLFQQSRMQWLLSFAPFHMPTSAGIIRVFTAICTATDCSQIFVGTSGGAYFPHKAFASLRTVTLLFSAIQAKSSSFKSLRASTEAVSPYAPMELVPSLHWDPKNCFVEEVTVHSACYKVESLVLNVSSRFINTLWKGKLQC